jgi:hypothetical protein
MNTTSSFAMLLYGIACLFPVAALFAAAAGNMPGPAALLTFVGAMVTALFIWWLGAVVDLLHKIAAKSS